MAASFVLGNAESRSQATVAAACWKRHPIMHPRHWEVEQKFALPAIAQVQQKLAALGAEMDPSVEQMDLYFNHPARDFGQTDEALRLRQVGLENYLTYKGPRIDSSTKTRSEIELPLPSGSNVIEDFIALLTALGFRPVGKVKKRRIAGRLTWSSHLVHLALDHVEGLGDFLEMEILADDRSLESARACLQTLAVRLGLNASERRSYLELLLAIQT